MGIGGIGTWQLIILLVIIILIFGSRRIRNIGSDLGASIKGFRKSVREEERDDAPEPHQIESSESMAARSGEKTKPSEQP